MCGITGLIAPKNQQNSVRLDRMVQSLKHRGPDAHASYWFSEAGLGHTRLAVVDLSPTGSQPMLSRNKQLGITFNGEIYGYQHLKKSFSDYPFISTSDTEVILALYEKYAENMLTRLPGQFAFALWDDKGKTLFAARDRMGEKPFYYAFGPHGEFLFASEMKALLASNLIKPEIDQDSLSYYLQHLYVHPHKTIYKNIYTLPPAHELIYKAGKVKVKRYWHLPKLNHAIGLDEAIARFQQLLTTAVQKQLVADVPVGAFLSGGIDSSSIVALASQLHPNLTTFSFGFEGKRSELPYARLAAKRYKTNHIELTEKENIAELLLKMQEVYDEPFADSSNIPTYLISKLAREHTTVALTGDGGDEICGGYAHWYRPLYWMLNEKPYFGKSFLLSLATHFMQKFNQPQARELLYRQAGLTLQNDTDSIIQAHDKQNHYFSNSEIKHLGLKPYSMNQIAYSNTMESVFAMDVEDYLPGDVLVKTDRASMAHGLELRAPFLDVDLIEFCLSLPFTLKLTRSEDKHLLRKALDQQLPKEIIKRPKQGFGAPIVTWLQRTDVQELIAENLHKNNRKVFSLLPFDTVQELSSQPTYKTWVLLTLSLWLENRDYL